MKNRHEGIVGVLNQKLLLTHTSFVQSRVDSAPESLSTFLSQGTCKGANEYEQDPCLLICSHNKVYKAHDVSKNRSCVEVLYYHK